MGSPAGRVRSRLSEGSAEKREENMLGDGQRKWMRECYLCQKLWLLFSQDSPLITPPSLLFTPIFSPALLCHSFSIFSPHLPLPLSVLLRLAFFSHFFLSVSCNKRLTERVWRLNEQHQPPREGREEGDGAGGWGKHTEVMTPSWRGVFPFLPASFWNLKEFRFISSHLLPSVSSLQHIQLYLPSEIERNGSSGSEVMKAGSFTNTQWDIRRREERVQQGCVQIFLKILCF